MFQVITNKKGFSDNVLKHLPLSGYSFVILTSQGLTVLSTLRKPC